ncbi:MAG: deiodinase-like protein [Saprospiraceae bacterium]
MRLIFTFSLFSLFISFTSGQSILKPFIGVDSLPDPSEPICTIPLYLGSFFDSGLQEGDTIPDFKLYSPDGNPFHISSFLSLDKPVLIVNGNYTCPVFRGKVPALNNLVSKYANEVTICVIYTVEAHPDIDISPYFGYVNTGSPNENAGILYRQPVTYGERLDIVSDMLNDLDIYAPVFVDGPCNNWWSVFGPAPNNAYLISPEGIVVAKHGWFNRAPDNMECDIENFLNGNTDCVSSGGSNGKFSFRLLSDSIANGSPGDVLYVEALLENTTSDPVDIEIKRLAENVPAGWSTSMCIDICYATTVDYTTIQIPAGETQLFIMDFFTDPVTAGNGMVQIGFRNLNDSNNKLTQRMYASTEKLSGVSTIKIQDLSGYVYPQPAADVAYLNIPETLHASNDVELRLYNIQGNMVLQMPIQSAKQEIVRGTIPAGLFSFQVINSGQLLGSGKLIFE